MSHQPEEISARLSTHEEVCAFRYEAINARLKRLEGIFIASAGAIILLLLSIVLAGVAIKIVFTNKVGILNNKP